MRFSFVIFLSLLLVVPYSNGSSCNCRTFRKCYRVMLKALRDRDEASCIEDATISSATLLIFLKAIKQFCSDIVEIDDSKRTAQGRALYEVVITINDEDFEEGKPTILIDGGQRAGTDSMGFALFIMSQLVACEEHDELLRRAKWVFMPSTNPDGQEYQRFAKPDWTKNLNRHEDYAGFGVDITRNFDCQWSACGDPGTPFAADYPGPKADSENETMFIKEVIDKHKDQIRAYVSIRRDGHGLYYPYAYTETKFPPIDQIQKAVDDIVLKVNQRAGSIQTFSSDSIFNMMDGRPGCGSSVDYAAGSGVKLAFEMRVFLEDTNEIIEKFHSLPKGYMAQLRFGYWAGIKEIYEVVTNDESYKIYSSNNITPDKKSRRGARGRRRLNFPPIVPKHRH